MSNQSPICGALLNNSVDNIVGAACALSRRNCKLQILNEAMENLLCSFWYGGPGPSDHFRYIVEKTWTCELNIYNLSILEGSLLI